MGVERGRGGSREGKGGGREGKGGGREGRGGRKSATRNTGRAHLSESLTLFDPQAEKLSWHAPENERQSADMVIVIVTLKL